jgi:hypothetical protein
VEWAAWASKVPLRHFVDFAIEPEGRLGAAFFFAECYKD